MLVGPEVGVDPSDKEKPHVSILSGLTPLCFEYGKGKVKGKAILPCTGPDRP
jgi:hypothetical protein